MVNEALLLRLYDSLHLRFHTAGEDRNVSETRGGKEICIFKKYPCTCDRGHGLIKRLSGVNADNEHTFALTLFKSITIIWK